MRRVGKHSGGLFSQRTRSCPRPARILRWRSSTAGRGDGGFHRRASGCARGRADPAQPSDRVRRDEALRPEILRVFQENWRVCGVRKIWRQLGREGFDVARCTVARPIKCMGLHGIIRGKPHRTTIPDNRAPCPLEKVNRSSVCLGRTCCGVVHCGAIGSSPMDDDFTSVTTWREFVHVAFVIDAQARRVAGRPFGPCGFRPRRG